MILKNPGGRLVEVDDEDSTRWLETTGFSIPSSEEADSYRDERWSRVNQLAEAHRVDESVYFSMLSSKGKKDGYGTAGNLIYKGLKDYGLNVTDVYNGNKVGVLFHSPYSIMRLESDYRIIFTMFESDKTPEDWKQYLEFANKIIVPSKWCQEVFKNDGYETEVVNLGYNDEVFKYHDRPKRDGGVFKFLHYDAFNLRKGFMELFDAFNKAFGENPNVKLVLKTTNKKSPLPIPPSAYPNIETITGETTQEELAELCNSCDAFVFPSRGEGFGITPLEAMATGLPTIVPNAHGISEYFNPEFMYECKVEGLVPATYDRYKGLDVGKMVSVDVDDLAEQMLYIYNHRGEAKIKGKAASEYVKQYSYKRTAKELKAIIDTVVAQPLPPKKVGRILMLERV